jgi:hypothetical protein
VALQKKEMRKIQVLLNTMALVAFLSPNLMAQTTIISSDSAISIALRNGLKIGLSEYEAELQKDTIWVVYSLLCDEYPGSEFDTKIVNAKTGRIIKNMFAGRVGASPEEYGTKTEKTKLNSNSDIDSLPIAKEISNRKLTELKDNESNPIFSENDSSIAFEYGFKKIGIIKADGTDFKQLCEGCRYHQWLDNKWIVYFNDSNYLNKKNIETFEEIRLTKEADNYSDYKISPDKRWVAFTKGKSQQEKDSLDGPCIRISFTPELDLWIMDIQQSIQWRIVNASKEIFNLNWTANSDSILFYISDKKYFVTDLYRKDNGYFRYDLLPNLSLWDYEKIAGNTFPIKYHCQIFEVDSRTLVPIRVLENRIGHYNDVFFSHNKKYLIYSKAETRYGDSHLWIKKFK